MQTVTVKASGTYNVHIGSGLLARSGELISAVTSAKSCAVITDSTVGPLYAKTLCDALESLYPERQLVVVMGMMNRKDFRTAVPLLAKRCRTFIAVPAGYVAEDAYYFESGATEMTIVLKAA